MKKMMGSNFTTTVCYYDEISGACYKQLPNTSLSNTDATKYDPYDLNVRL